MYNHNKAQQSKNRVHISWDILYHTNLTNVVKAGTTLCIMNQAISFHTLRPVIQLITNVVSPVLCKAISWNNVDGHTISLSMCSINYGRKVWGHKWARWRLTGLSIVCPTVCSGVNQRKHKAPCHWPLWGDSTVNPWIPHMDSPYRRPKTHKIFPFDVWWHHNALCFQPGDRKVLGDIFVIQVSSTVCLMAGSWCSLPALRISQNVRRSPR